MSLFETAAQDPIFWLHHSNIDRLWETWRNQPGHALPTDNAWLRQHFEIGSGTALVSLKVGDVLDSTAAPLRYRC
jgi:tyrosinase